MILDTIIMILGASGWVLFYFQYEKTQRLQSELATMRFEIENMKYEIRCLRGEASHQQPQSPMI